MRQPSGAVWKAISQSPAAIAQKERVKPQKGPGYPLRRRNVHRISGKECNRSQAAARSGRAATRKSGKCTTSTSQGEGGRLQDRNKASGGEVD